MNKIKNKLIFAILCTIMIFLFNIKSTNAHENIGEITTATLINGGNGAQSTIDMFTDNEM